MGTTPTEKINLSRKGLRVASAYIIASCIKENGVLKELRCAARLSLPAFASGPTNIAFCLHLAVSPTTPFAVW